MSRVVAAAQLIVIACVAGCGGSHRGVVSDLSRGVGDNAGGSMFRTERSTYALQDIVEHHQWVIRATLTNRLPYTLYVVGCQNSALIALEERVADQWQAVYRPVCLLRGEPPIVVKPGHSFHDVFRLPPTLLNAPELVGRYRVEYSVYRRYSRDSTTGTLVADRAPAVATISNDFAIVGP